MRELGAAEALFCATPLIFKKAVNTWSRVFVASTQAIQIYVNKCGFSTGDTGLADITSK